MDGTQKAPRWLIAAALCVVMGVIYVGGMADGYDHGRASYKAECEASQREVSKFWMDVWDIVARDHAQPAERG